ncbi:MAG: helix-turn-helix transcriptional regulator [Oscillospiraceae bacterium]|nr:helix-turn-helix transcriptional regulator [Oscillospiraceae bacterium]
MVSFRPFRELMKKRGITTYYLRNKCQQYNLGNKTLERLMHDESVSTNTIDALCQIFGCEVTEIMEILPDTPNDETAD